MTTKRVKPTKKPSLAEPSSPETSQPELGTPPQRNKSAFILFSTQLRKQIKAESQTELNSNEMMILLASKWKTLNPKEKVVFETEAEQDKQRYQKELKAYETSLGCKFIKNKTKNNHIKKPCSSYGIFLRENKEAVREKNPNKKMADILKIISQEWKSIDKQTKKKYEEMAKEDKLRVNAERNGTAPAKAEKKQRRKISKKSTDCESEAFDCKKESERSEMSIDNDDEEVLPKHVKVETESNLDLFELKNITAAGSVDDSNVASSGFIADSMTHLLDSVDFSSFNQYDDEMKFEKELANKNQIQHENVVKEEEEESVKVSKRTTDLIVDLINFDTKQDDNSSRMLNSHYKFDAFENFNHNFSEKNTYDFINYRQNTYNGLISENLGAESHHSFGLDWM